MKEKINELAGRLLDLPDSILDLQMQLIDKSAELQKVESQIGERSSEIKYIINNALDDNGKKLYSNAELRDAAFISDAKDDILLPSLNVDRELIQNSIQSIRVKVENLSNHQRNIRVLISYITTDSNIDNL